MQTNDDSQSSELKSLGSNNEARKYPLATSQNVTSVGFKTKRTGRNLSKDATDMHVVENQLNDTNETHLQTVLINFV